MTTQKSEIMAQINAVLKEVIDDYFMVNNDEIRTRLIDKKFEHHGLMWLFARVENDQIHILNLGEDLEDQLDSESAEIDFLGLIIKWNHGELESDFIATFDPINVVIGPRYNPKFSPKISTNDRKNNQEYSCEIA